jgi:hypothetical protein
MDFGDGIAVSSDLVVEEELVPTTADIVRATVERSARAGVANFAATVSLAQSLLECNFIDLDGETIDGVPFVFEDAGDNVCRCGAETYTCQVVTSNIQPPLPSW